jgi:putative ABC transport system substrate-binding protein
VDRRGFLAGAATLLAAPLAVKAQPTGKVSRIGFLGNARVTELVSNMFSTGLRERGWVEGQNFVWERRFSEGRNERFPGLAADLVQAKPDVIIAHGTAAAVAAKAATTTIPIVFYSVADPVGSGLVASMARPAGNATGLGGLGPRLHAKMLELLKEAVPRATRIGILVNPDFTVHTAYRHEVELVARPLNITLLPVEVRVPEQLDDAFTTGAREKLDAIMILGQPMMFVLRVRAAKLALDHRMPTIIVWHEAVLLIRDLSATV